MNSRTSLILSQPLFNDCTIKKSLMGSKYFIFEFKKEKMM